MKILTLISLLLVVNGAPAGALTPTELKTRAQLEKAALRYFIENANPETGLVRDQANSFTKTPADNVQASIAATGFGIAAIANAAARGLVSRAWGEAYFTKVMRFCRDHVPREHGWFLHWMNWQTGQSVYDDNNDFSTVDTSFFIGGALYAEKIFPHSEGARIARQLYLEVDFPFMLTDDGKFPDRLSLATGYSKAHGFIPYQWTIYAEQQLLVLLGIGHPAHPIPPAAWQQWERRKYQSDGFDVVALDMPLFVHQYSQMFVDFRGFADGFPNYFENSVRASEFNRFMALKNTRYRTLREGFWGFSAGQAPGAVAEVYHSQKNLYAGDPESYGVYDGLRHKSTVCIACAIGSVTFMPETVLRDARQWRHNLGGRIFGRYGFTDSLNLDLDWISQKSLGITVGTAYLSLSNLERPFAVRSVFTALPEIQSALNKLRQ